MKSLVPTEIIENRILLIRGQKVMLDSDLADLYGVTTKRLNEQVKRNRGRFPEAFMFQLRSEEKAQVVANCDHLSKLKFSATLPYTFTEHGALMVASVLNTPRAIEISIFVVKAFVKLREMIATNKVLSRRLDELEKKSDGQFKIVFDALRALMAPPMEPKRKIGFDLKDKQGKYGKKKG